VSGTNIVNGTYYWNVTNTGDFGTSSGSFTITSNSGSFSVSPTADSSTEGSETFVASIWSGSVGGTFLASTGSITINDTSTTPIPPDPQLNASTSGPFFNYIIFGPNSNTKAYYIQIFRDPSGPFTQNWSISTSLGIQTGFGGATSGTFTAGGITNAIVGFNGPHSTAFVFVNVSAPGYTAYNTVLVPPANSVYTPYTLTNGFSQEFGRSGTALTLTQNVIEFYESRFTPYTTTLSPPTRYGLNRRGETSGVNFWVGQAIAFGWTVSGDSSSMAFKNGILGNPGETYTSPSTAAFNQGTGYGAFIDKP
jgi:hypothetical protein